MGWTFTQMTSYLKFRMGERSELESASDQTANLFELWINSAYRQLTNSDRVWGLELDYCFPDLNIVDDSIVTVDGEGYITTPSDCLYVEEVYDYTNKRQLDWMPLSEYVGYIDRFDTSAEGKPTKWHRRGAYIYLYRTPDTNDEAMYVYYRKRVPSMAGMEETLIGEEWDEVILVLAAIKGFMWLSDWDKVRILKDEWKELAMALVGHPHKEQRAQRASIKPELNYSDKEYYGR